MRYKNRLLKGGQGAPELLGEPFSGSLVTDRSSAYNWYPVRWRQVCWAHLLRDCEAMRGRGGPSRKSVTPCWHKRTRCLRGGIGCGRARYNARRFGLHDPASPRGGATVRSGQAVWGQRPPGRVGIS